MLSDQERIVSTTNKLVRALNESALDPRLTLTVCAMLVASVLDPLNLSPKDFEPMLNSAVLMRMAALHLPQA